MAATRITCAPAAPSFIVAGASARSEVITQSGVSRAEWTSRLLPGNRSARSSTTRTGERASMPGSRQVKQRIIRQHRADADQDGVALRAQHMHPRPRRLARDRDRLAAGGADHVVGGHRELEQHLRAVIPDAAEMAGMVARRFLGAEPDVDSDTRRAQLCMALPGNFRIRVLDRRHHARNAGGNDGVGARWRAAEMRARLQRHVEGSASRGLAGAPQGFGFGVRTAACLRPSPPDDDPIVDDDRANRRVGPGAALAAPAERERELHEAQVGGFRLPGFFRELVFQDAEDHLRNVATRGSSSPESSPSTASKSLASRKLR